jgi:hypothetical protein
MVKDFVIVKRRRVELALEFLDLSPGSGNVSLPQAIQRRLEIQYEVGELNGGRLRRTKSDEDRLVDHLLKSGVTAENFKILLETKGG